MSAADEGRFATVLVNGRIVCGPLLKVSRNAREVAQYARYHAKVTGREREVDAPMLDKWGSEEVARRIKCARNQEAGR